MNDQFATLSRRKRANQFNQLAQTRGLEFSTLPRNYSTKEFSNTLLPNPIGDRIRYISNSVFADRDNSITPSKPKPILCQSRIVVDNRNLLSKTDGLKNSQYVDIFVAQEEKTKRNKKEKEHTCKINSYKDKILKESDNGISTEKLKLNIKSSENFKTATNLLKENKVARTELAVSCKINKCKNKNVDRKNEIDERLTELENFDDNSEFSGQNNKNNKEQFEALVDKNISQQHSNSTQSQLNQSVVKFNKRIANTGNQDYLQDYKENFENNKLSSASSLVKICNTLIVSPKNQAASAGSRPKQQLFKSPNKTNLNNSQELILATTSTTIAEQKVAEIKLKIAENNHHNKVSTNFDLDLNVDTIITKEITKQAIREKGITKETKNCNKKGNIKNKVGRAGLIMKDNTEVIRHGENNKIGKSGQEALSKIDTGLGFYKVALFWLGI